MNKLYSCLLGLITFFSSPLYPQTGPGGVGNASGSGGQPSNSLWLRANSAVFETGGLVDSWVDQSGNSLTANGAGATRPSYVASDPNFNNLPTLSFSPTGTNKHVVVGDADILDNTSGFSSFIVFRPVTVTGIQALISKRTAVGANQSYVFFRNVAAVTSRITTNDVTSGAILSAGTPAIISTVFNGSIVNPRTFQFTNGTGTASGNGPISIPNNASDLFIAAFDNSGGETRNLDGNIAEVIIYRTAINAAQRQIVENYLSAKYNLALSSGDVYAGDTPGNGNYDFDVVGIGRQSGQSHVEANSTGFILSIYNGTFDNDGEFLLAGHNNTSNSVSLANLGVGIEQRWARSWYVDKTTSNGLDAALSFDFEQGIGGEFPQNKDDYELLRFDGVNYSIVPVSSPNKLVSGKRITFRVENADLIDGVYTLGTTDAVNSPVNGGANKTWYSYQSGDWTNPSVWTLDGGVVPLLVNPANEVPSPTDNVSITTGKTVFMVDNNRSVNSISVTGTLDIGNTSGHNFTSISGNGRIRFAGNVGNDNFPSGSVTNFASPTIGGTAEVYGSGVNLNQPRIFNRLVVNLSSGSATLLANYTIHSDLIIENGVLQINNGSSTTPKVIRVEGNTLIQSGASITTGNANARHQFDLLSDLSVEAGASVSFTNRVTPGYTTEATDGIVDANFIKATGDQQITCNGACNFYRIKIDKGVDDTHKLRIQASTPANFNLFGFANEAHGSIAQLADNANALGLLRGTVEIANNVNIPVLSNSGNYNVSVAATLWVNGGTVNKNNGNSLVPYGKVKLSAGTLTANVAAGITTRDNGSIIVEGGVLQTNQIRTSVLGPTNIGGYIQSGGTVTVDGGGPGGTGLDYYVFALNYAGNVFQMSGGTLIVKGARAGTGGLRGAIFINSDPANISVTGGTVIMEISNNNIFKVTSRAPFWNVTMRRTAGTATQVLLDGGTSGTGAGTETLAVQPLIVKNDLQIQNNINFNANSANLSIGGNWTIQNTGLYTPGTNTTTVEGIGISTLSFTNVALTRVLSGLTIAKQNPTNEVIISTGAPTAIQIDGELRVESGLFNYNNFIVRSTADVYLSSTVGAAASTGRLQLQGSAAQTINSSNGIVHNLELDNTNGITLALGDLTVLRQLTLTNGVFSIGSNKLSLSGSSAALIGTGFSVTKMITTGGISSDGGLELYVDANEVMEYPLGVAGKYTPARAQFQGFSDDGYVIINPVDEILATTNLSGGPDILSYYWRVRHREFSTLPTVSYEFFYDNADIGGNEANYVPGKVLDALPFTRSSEAASDIVQASNQLVFNGSSTGAIFPGLGFTLELANYTAGGTGRFTGVPTIYYSRSAGATGFPGNSWHNNASWSLVSHSGAAAPSFPAAGDIAIIGSGDTGGNPHHAIQVSTADAFAAEIIFATVPAGVFNPRVTVNQNRNITVGKVSGRGDFMVRVNAGQVPTVIGDFGEFAEQEASTFIYWTNAGASITLPSNPLVFPNLRFEGNRSGFGTRRMTIPGNIVVNRDIRIDEYATFVVGGDVWVKRDIRVGAGAGGYAGILEFATTGTSRKVRVDQDLWIRNSTNQTPDVVVLNGTPSSLNHSISIGRNILIEKGTMTLFNAGANANVATLKLFGVDTGNYTNTAGTTPAWYRMIVDKGNSVATIFTMANNATLGGATNSATKAIELQNGLLMLNNATINYDLSTGGGDFRIPSSAGLEVAAGTVNVSGNDTGILLDGLLRISGGTVNMNDGVNNGNNYIEYSASNQATLEISAGSLIVGSQIRRSLTSTAGSLKYTQTGGTVEVGRNAAPSITRGVFEIVNNGSAFNHAAGSLTLVRGINSSTVPSLLLEPQTPTIFTPGATITIGNVNTPAGANSQNIGIRATNRRIANLTINNASGNNPYVKLISSVLQVDGTLLIESGTTLDAQNLDMILRGTFNVNGTFIPGTNTVSFPTGPSFISGIFEVPFFNLTKTAGGILTLNVPIRIMKDLTIIGGTIQDNSNTITLLGDAIINTTHASTGGEGIVFAGSTQQQLRRTAPGTGNLGIITIDNTAGVLAPNGAGYNFNINLGLRMVRGVFDIGGSLLTLAAAAPIVEVNLFGTNNMIQTNSSFTDSGVRKLFAASTSPVFTYPVGIGSKYTPAILDFSSGSTGTGTPSITVKTANERNAGIIDDDETGEFDGEGTPCLDNNDVNNVLQYNWIITANNVAASLTGDLVLNYLQSDVATEVYTEADYIPARILDAGGVVNKFPSLGMNTSLNTITFNLGGTTAAGISGQYFAGADCAIPNTIPIYTTVVSGNFGQPVYDQPVPGGGAPVGAIVVISNGTQLNFNTDGARFYRTEINGTLQVNSGTIGHRLGTVSGTGTLRLQVLAPETSTVLPAAFYGDFFDCAGGTLELAGNTDYSVPGGITILRQLLLTGTGGRAMANNDILICNDLVVQGPTFSNPNSRGVIIERDLLVNSGSFLSGSSNAIQIDRNLAVAGGTFNGQAGGTKIVNGNLNVSSGTFTAGSGGIFSLRGNLNSSGGTFSGGSSLHRFIFEGPSVQRSNGNISINRFEINNPSGLIIETGNVTVSNELLLTNGVIYTTGNPFTLTTTATAFPVSGSTTSFVDGQLRKTLPVGASFIFPIGKTGRWRPTSVINTSSGAFTWQAEFFPGPATNEPIVTNLVPVAPVVSISAGEYWKISDGNVAPSGVQSTIGLQWGWQTDVSPNFPERETMVVVAWNEGTSQWENFGGTNFSAGHTQSQGSFNATSPISFSEKVITIGSTSLANPLPVELEYFYGKREGGVHKITWVTASELNNDYFELERSADGESFSLLGRRAGQGTTNERTTYRFEDDDPLSGPNYYRLKQVDFDGTVTYSKVIIISNNDNINFTLSIFPNPVNKGKTLTIRVRKPNAYGAQLKVYDMVGRVVFTAGIQEEGLNEVEFPISETISAGVYLVELQQGERRIMRRLIIQ